jgi:predicted metalloprotease with PDZ domain
MKYYYSLIFLLGLYSATLAQNNEAYQYKVDINNVVNDALTVELLVPTSITKDNPTFYFPKIIPGTYEISNYGRFVKSLKAYDKKGNSVTVERKDENTWDIKGKKITRITYQVDDTWDADVRKSDAVFEASGSNFEAGKNFVLCANACFGFFEGSEKLPFEVTFDRPANFYATTSLKRTGGDFDSDIFRVQNYHDLVDAPIMYCKPDTVNFKLGYGDIQISVYSPNGIVSAEDIAKEISPMLTAQSKYLGNILPVDRYAFIIYLSPDGYKSGNVGALEHARSSLFCLTEEKAEKISKLVVDIASHEFFHMVTPLYIHSEEIHNFDFINPKMSKHLWLYEGVIEYMAQHMQAKYDLVSDEDFLIKIRDKVRNSTRYKQAISLSEMSKKCLIEPYSKQYNNIYYKGAVVAMCLDLELLKHSNGQYDIQMLLRDLSGYYGQDTPFKDEELYDKIIEITGNRQLSKFFERYIEGTEQLPYDKFVEPFGIEYLEEADILEISPLGGMENGVLKTDSLDRFYVSKAQNMDVFGKESIGLKQDDIILKWNKKKLTARSVSAVLITYMNSVKAGDELEVVVLREGAEVTLNSTVTKIPVKKKHVFKMREDATPEQLELRKRWLEAQG